MNTELEDTLAEALRRKASTVPQSAMPRLGAQAPRPSRRGWLVPVAAAAVAIAGVAGVAVALQPGAEPPAATTAAKPKPGTLAPGEVYYSLEVVGDADGANPVRRELWQSPERTGPWRQRVDGADVVQGPTAGRCYPAQTATDEECTRPGSWFSPTVDFLAKASRDPATIAKQLHAEAVQEERDRVNSGDFVQTGQTFSAANLAYLELNYLGSTLSANGMSADVVVALKKVVTGFPGIEARENVANLDGRRGTGFSLRDVEGRPLTLIFDGDTYIGTPTSSVEHGVAPALGKPPSRTF